MTHEPNETHDAFGHSLKRSYARALRWMIAGWLVGIAFVVPLVGSDSGMLPDALAIAVASAAIACLSMIPGFLTLTHTRKPARPERQTETHGSRFAGSLAAGMLIRVTGTVALFLTCRYHMATTTEMIAGMTIGWYLLLTSLEVLVLARELPKTAKAPNFPGSDFPETDFPGTGSVDTPTAVKV
jgi:hypothetical protein